MSIATKKVKELKYYLRKQKKVLEELTSDSWDPLHIINLRIAFKRGYEAKHSYNKKK